MKRYFGVITTSFKSRNDEKGYFRIISPLYEQDDAEVLQSWLEDTSADLWQFIYHQFGLQPEITTDIREVY